jgi:hypothetical protein
VGKISTVFLLLYDFLSLKNDVNVPVFQVRMFLGLPDPHPNPLVKRYRTDPKMRKRNKMSRVRNTAQNVILIEDILICR